MKYLSYEDWYDINQDNINAELAESGADRELCFNSELEFENRYETYVHAKKQTSNASQWDDEDDELVFLCDDYRHLICEPYSIDNLHRMAIKLGIAACWFHKDHYDIPKRRIVEITKQCVKVRPRDIELIVNRNGRNTSN